MSVFRKQGPQGLQKLSYLKSIKIQNPEPLKTRKCTMKPLEMASLPDFRWQNLKERPKLNAQ